MNRIARVLVVTDLHKPDKDMTSIKGQREASEAIQHDLINLVKEKEITHVLIAGDWYHKGFHSLCEIYHSMSLDKMLSEAVNGNVYLTIGNHFYLDSDENPEMYIIQPNDTIKPKRAIATLDKPIFNMVPELVIGDVKFSFFHFSKTNKTYVNFREPNIKYHIGIYHDDTVVPSWVREKEGILTRETSLAYLNKIYSNIDLAICGHIHTKIGMATIELVDRTVPIAIPGSLGITQNKEIFKHMDVQLPVLDIYEDSSVELKYATVSTHMELLKFYDKKKKSAIDAFDVNREKIHYDSDTVNKNLGNLSIYLRTKGYNERVLKLVESSMQTPLNATDALNILSQSDEPTV